MKLLTLFSLLAISIAAEHHYDGFQVLRLVPRTYRAKELLPTVTKDVITLKVIPGENTIYDVAVSPKNLDVFRSQLEQMNIETTVLVQNLEELIQSEKVLNEIAKSKSKSRKESRMEHTYYRTLDETNQELDNLVASYPNLMSKMSIGQTYGGRDINMMKVSSGGGDTRQIIWIDCGIHAREWVAPASCLLFLDRLSDYGSDAEITALLDTYDFLVLTIVNPDGYDYTWTDDRLWRKNRFPSGTCYGIDLNRNFDSDFGGPGTSDNACLDTYHGPSAFSELETQAIRDAVLAQNGRIKMFFTLHSYSQLWMYPYGYTRSLTADDTELNRVAGIGVNALESVFGTVYSYGSIARIIYEAAGGSVDWTYDSAGIVYSYALELRDTGTYGFLLPPEEIDPTATEAWEGMKAAINAAQ